MAKKNILIKKSNSDGWDELYPITSSNNVISSNGKSVESEINSLKDSINTKQNKLAISDSVSSTSTTTVANSASVKKAYDKGTLAKTVADGAVSKADKAQKSADSALSKAGVNSYTIKSIDENVKDNKIIINKNVTDINKIKNNTERIKTVTINSENFELYYNDTTKYVSYIVIKQFNDNRTWTKGLDGDTSIIDKDGNKLQEIPLNNYDQIKNIGKYFLGDDQKLYLVLKKGQFNNQDNAKAYLNDRQFKFSYQKDVTNENLDDRVFNLETRINNMIEKGSNNNGNYIKFEDGTMICYGNIKRSLSIEKKNILFMSSFDKEFFVLPSEFIDSNIYISIDMPNTEFVASSTRGIYNSTFNPALWFDDDVLNNSIREIRYLAIGRWK